MHVVGTGAPVTAPARWILDIDGAGGVMIPFLIAGPS